MCISPPVFVAEQTTNQSVSSAIEKPGALRLGIHSVLTVLFWQSRNEWNSEFNHKFESYNKVIWKNYLFKILVIYPQLKSKFNRILHVSYDSMITNNYSISSYIRNENIPFKGKWNNFGSSYQRYINMYIQPVSWTYELYYNVIFLTVV